MEEGQVEKPFQEKKKAILRQGSSVWKAAALLLTDYTNHSGRLEG